MEVNKLCQRWTFYWLYIPASKHLYHYLWVVIYLLRIFCDFSGISESLLIDSVLFMILISPNCDFLRSGENESLKTFSNAISSLISRLSEIIFSNIFRPISWIGHSFLSKCETFSSSMKRQKLIGNILRWNDSDFAKTYHRNCSCVRVSHKCQKPFDSFFINESVFAEFRL